MGQSSFPCSARQAELIAPAADALLEEGVGVLGRLADRADEVAEQLEGK
jgi:hypothetical protein